MKNVVFFVTIIVFLFIINNFFHSIYSLWQKQDLIVTARKELEQEKVKQQELEKELKRVEAPEYLEEEARNKLFLVKPGEEIVVMPTGPIEPPIKQVTLAKKPDPVWRQWYALVD